MSLDGDPLDILVIAPVPVVAGAVIRCRPVGALIMTDQAGEDEKVLAGPTIAPLQRNMAEMGGVSQSLGFRGALKVSFKTCRS